MFGDKGERRAKQAERQRKAQLSLLSLKATGFSLKIKDDEVHEFMKKNSGGSMKGAKASVQTEGEIRDRFTATRILALGVFALAFKKKTSDKDVFLVIEGDGFVLSEHVKNKKESDARQFARDFNAYVAAL
ncbi:hypothetical protein GCM10009744_12560 [Kribbella alba]|uniref:Uncharacterized protein n=1 Tax=Kribbella alba TaxID=190197 RepID=A0ABN2F3E0_9ACTN